MVRGSPGNRGISAVGAVLALLIFSLLVTVAVSLVTTGASTGLQEELGIKAFYIAEGGLRYALKNGTAPCGYDHLSPVPLGGGSFVVNATCMGTWAGCTAPAALSAGVTDIDTAVAVDTTAGYVIPGTFMLEGEYVFCNAVSANQFSQCARGFAGTAATAHAAGVQPLQCTVTSTGTYSAGVFFGQAKRTVRANVGE
ncbi:MAG: hypothetical protein PVG55_01380 [Nitrospirota bacterium]|jgi:hypothetical protein